MYILRVLCARQSLQNQEMSAALACRRHNRLKETRSPMASTKAACIMLLALVVSAALCDGRPALVRLGSSKYGSASSASIPSPLKTFSGRCIAALLKVGYATNAFLVCRVCRCS